MFLSLSWSIKMNGCIKLKTSKYSGRIKYLKLKCNGYKYRTKLILTAKNLLRDSNCPTIKRSGIRTGSSLVSALKVVNGGEFSKVSTPTNTSEFTSALS